MATGTDTDAPVTFAGQVLCWAMSRGKLMVGSMRGRRVKSEIGGLESVRTPDVATIVVSPSAFVAETMP